MLYILNNKGVYPMEIGTTYFLNKLSIFLSSYTLYTIVIKKNAVFPIK